MVDITSPVLTRSARAKINLYLHVVGRQDDGYHLLDSLVAFAELGDVLGLSPAMANRSGPTLTITGPFAPALAGEPVTGNLVIRATALLAARLGRSADVQITLDKQLPVASGIGGGSADAAACLLALAELWELPPDAPILYEVAGTLGADIPACLAGRPLFFGGIGDQLTDAPSLPDCPAVLVNPNVPVPTPAVFRARSATPFSGPARFADAPGDVTALATLLAERRNDLTAPALTVAPVIAKCLAALDQTRQVLLARLSGSGATCFALYPDQAAAKNAATVIKAAYPDWWVQPTRLLPS